MYRSSKKENAETCFPYIRSIVETFKSVDHRPGSFASGGQFLFPPPALKINGMEDYVGLPVGKLQAKAIIAVCAQAPYGKGQETVEDTTVRSTWELDPSQFTIMNPLWNSQLKKLAAVVKEDLGCDPKLKVKCDLYKFLLYEQGSFFKPHRDTEKVDRMFGTLVIQLPSDYDGGVLRVRHRNEEQKFDFSGPQGIMNYNYAAFYADCEHELCEVTRGYRLCLIYNLVYSGDGACPVPIDNSEVVAKVVEDMRTWEQDDDGLPYMAYVLDHSYCEASLSFELLKNGDRAKAEVILEAEKQIKFCIYLGMITLEQHCSMDCDSWYDHGYGSTREDYHVDDIEKESFTVGTLVSPTGNVLDGSVKLTHDAFVPKDVFEYSEPIEEDFEPKITGATLDRTYHEAVLFIWPRKHTILVTGDVKVAIKNLNSKLCKFQDSQQQQGECENLAKEITAVCKNSEFCPSIEDMISFLSCLKRLKDIVLVCELFKGIAVHHLHLLQCRQFCESVVELGDAFGWEQLEEALAALFEGAVTRRITSVCNFLSSLATGSLSSQQLKVCQKMVSVICHALTNEQDITNHNPQGACSKDLICELFKIFCRLECEDQLVIVIPSFLRQPERYSIENALVPAAIELNQTMKKNSSIALSSLISQCVSTLEQLTQQAPTWFVQVNLKCHCRLCKQLAKFLKDPDKSVTCFRYKLPNRRHLEEQLMNHHSDVSFVTDRRTSPYCLRVKKNDDSFSTYRTRLALLDRIRPLLGQKKPPVKRQKLDDDSKK